MINCSWHRNLNYFIKLRTSMETLLIIINHLIVFTSLCLEIIQCISYDIEETNRNAVAISLVSGVRHRANGNASIFHIEKTTSLFLSTDSRKRSSNEERKKREREREREKKKWRLRSRSYRYPIDIARRTEEIGWSSSARKLSESRAHNYKHSVRRVSCSRTFVFFERSDSTILQKGNYSCLLSPCIRL